MWEFFRKLWRNSKPNGDSEPGRKDFDAAIDDYHRGDYAASITGYDRAIDLNPADALLHDMVHYPIANVRS